MSTSISMRTKNFDSISRNATDRYFIVDVFLDGKFLAQRHFSFETPLDSDLISTRQFTRALRSLAYRLDQLDKN